MSFPENLPAPLDVLREPGYDPADYLIDEAVEHGNIAAVPAGIAGDDVLLRWYPWNALDLLHGQQAPPKELLQMAVVQTPRHYNDELQRLRDLGIDVVGNRSQELRLPPTVLRQPLWIATVRRVTGNALSIADPEGHGIPDKVATYFDEAGDRPVLGDIQYPQQYMVAIATGSPQLVDIERRYMHPQTRNIAGLRAWQSVAHGCKVA